VRPHEQHQQARQAVDAITAARHWPTPCSNSPWTTGGFDDHVVTPNVEHTPDGVQLGCGPRVPLLILGGRVRPGIDNRWNSHLSIGRTVVDLLGLPPLGVPRLDQATSLADLINPAATTPPPPTYGTTITQPSPPTLTPAPTPVPPPPTGTSTFVGPIVLRDGSILPPPDDQPVRLPAR
jgi:hypothetical protein